MQLTGWANIFGVKIGGGWVGRHVDTDTPAPPNGHSNLFYLGAAYQITPAFTLDGEVFRITNAEQDARGKDRAAPQAAGVFSVSASFQDRIHRTKLSAARQTCSVSDGLAVHPILASAGYRL